MLNLAQIPPSLNLTTCRCGSRGYRNIAGFSIDQSVRPQVQSACCRMGQSADGAAGILSRALEFEVHDVKTDPAEVGVLERSRHRTDDFKAKTPIKLHGSGIGCRNRIELHPGVTRLLRPIDRELE